MNTVLGCIIVSLFLTSSFASLTENEPDIPAFAIIVESKFVQLFKRVESLDNADKQTKDDVRKLRAEIQEYKRRAVTLEREVQRLKSRTATCEVERATVVDEDAENLRNKSETYEELTGRSRISQTERQGERYSRSAPQSCGIAIAFYAVHSNHQTHVGVNQSIVFDNIITNIGKGYNPNFGAFIAPVAGIYVFSTTITGLNIGEFTCHLVMNGRSTAILYMRSIETYNDGDSATVVLYLNQGDYVAVKNVTPDASIYGLGYSNFGGFLLHQLSSPASVVIGK